VESQAAYLENQSFLLFINISHQPRWSI
jgi:hypothetical protein